MENCTTNGTADSITTSLTPISEIVMFCVIFPLGISANGLVIYVTGFKMKTTLNSVWFLNLALADFFYIFPILLDIVDFFCNWTCHFGDFLEKFTFVLRGICVQTSISLLTVMSMDRCLTVWAVVWARNKRTPNKARLICVIVWLVSLVCNVPFGIYNSIVANNQCIDSEEAFIYKCRAMFRFVFGFVIPFLIITCCYVAIGIRANQIKREKIRPFLIILAVILIFFLFWLPYHIMTLIITDQLYIYSRNTNLVNMDLFNKAVSHYWVTYILAFLHSCLNPFLYIFMCEEFKQKLKRSVFLVLEHAFAE